MSFYGSYTWFENDDSLELSDMKAVCKTSNYERDRLLVALDKHSGKEGLYRIESDRNRSKTLVYSMEKGVKILDFKYRNDCITILDSQHTVHRFKTDEDG